MEDLSSSLETEVPLFSEEIHGDDKVCARGELLLKPDELQSLNKFLTHKASQWRFVALPAWTPAAQTAAQLLMANVGSLPAPLAASAAAPGAAAKQQSKQFKPSQAAIIAPLSVLPDWARRLHKLLSSLGAQEISRPFLDSMPYRDLPFSVATSSTVSGSVKQETHNRERTPHLGPAVNGNGGDGGLSHHHMTRNSASGVQRRIIEADILPYLEPKSIRLILQKLENNGYKSALEVFNDVYGFFIGCYRHYAPGSPQWMAVFEISRTWIGSVSNSPLKDDFLAPPPPPVSTAVKTTTTAGAAASSSGTQHPSVVAKKPAVKKKNGKKSRKFSSSSRVRTFSSSPLEDRERRIFQSLLGRLPLTAHSALYNTFRIKATWKKSTAGQVELDDALTRPAVFREMVSWCNSKIKRKRAAAVAAGTSVTPQTSATRRKLIRRGSATSATTAVQPLLAAGQLPPPEEPEQEEEDPGEEEDDLSSESTLSDADELIDDDIPDGF